MKIQGPWVNKVHIKKINQLQAQTLKQKKGALTVKFLEAEKMQM